MKLYIVDAFANELFSGNPAGVCPLDNWIPESLMQQIAFENNLAETAFVVPEDSDYRIRWFTPTLEVDLCGHATLASAHVLFNHLGIGGNEIRFNSRSGLLKVTRNGSFLTLDFPADELTPTATTKELLDCFPLTPVSVYKGRTDYMFVFSKEEEIAKMSPNLNAIERLDARGVIITAPGKEADFVSRFFAPQSGVDEDPVTGSAHTTLTPYWSEQLHKIELKAIQLSERKGKLMCELQDHRVLISGEAVTYMIGEIQTNKMQ